MKKIMVLMVGLFFCMAGAAQEKKDDFSQFMDDALKDFDTFMDEADRDFIEFMRNPWKELKAKEPVKKRVKPEPVEPVIFDVKAVPELPKPVCLTVEEILNLSTEEGKQKPVTKVNDQEDIEFENPVVVGKKPKQPTIIRVEQQPADKQPVTPKPADKQPVAPKPADKQPVAPKPADKQPVAPKPADKQPVTPKPADKQPVAPKPADKQPVTPKPADKQPVAPKPVVKPETNRTDAPLYRGGNGRTAISFIGTTYYFPNDLNGRCRLSSLKENAIADAYESLYKSDYKSLLTDCKQLIQELSLNDWGTYTLVRAISDTYCKDPNAGVVMQQFLLNGMGYKAKMARKADANKMLLFVATDCMIYGHPYVQQGGLTYYSMNEDTPCSFYMCPKDAPSARQTLRMGFSESPRFKGSMATSTHRAKGSATRVDVSVSKALMDYYKSFPQCDYSVYFKAPVNPNVEQVVLSALSAQIQGKSEVDAANLLINFVQTAFEYATDDVQFGYEKPFFVEELFYYPYSDCEDRSMLFSYLVRKLLKLDVVLLDYPNHIATAVRFKSQVAGDYLMVEGERYTVCDPTYIGASIGMTMPQYKTAKVKVLKYD